MKNSYNTTDDYSFMLKGPVDDDYGNTPESAGELHIGDAIKVVSDYYEDYDYMYINPQQDGLYYFDFSSSVDNIDAFLKSIDMFDSNNERIFVSRVDTKLYFRPNVNSRSIISIRGNNNEFKYPKIYSFAIKGPVKDDYGNSKEFAHTIELMDRVAGFSDSPYDRDYFAFKCPENGLYKIDFTYTANYSSTLDLFFVIGIIDADGNTVNIRKNTRTALFDLNKDKIYYFVINNGGYTSLYNYSFVLNGPIRDDYGNSKEMSFNLSLNNEIKGQIDDYIDNDFFVFKPSASGAYYLSDLNIVNTGEESNYLRPYFILRITDSRGYSIEFDDKSESKVSFYLVKDNTYYISFISSSEHLYNYSFILKGPIPDDFGNTYSYASELKPSKTLEGRIDFFKDKDCFTFTTDLKGLYCISSTNITNFGLNHKDNIGTEIIPVNFDVNEYYYYLPANETYYITIDGNGAKSNNYTICLKTPIFDDYYNTTKNCTIIKADTPVKGAINYSGDIDALQIIPQSTGYMYFKFDAPSYLSLKIFDKYDFSLKYSNVRDNIYFIDLKDLNAFKIEIDSYDILLKGEYTITFSEKLANLLEDKDYKVDETYSFPGTDDFGNTPTFSKTIDIGNNIDGKVDYLGDVDCFSFTATTKSFYHIISQQDINYSIRDTTNKPASSYYVGDIGYAYYLKPDETYYITITLNNKKLDPYTFCIKDTLPDDYLNAGCNAEMIRANIPVNGSVNYSGDMDFLKFEAQDSGTMYIKFDAPSSLSLQLYNSVPGDIICKYLKDNVISFSTGDSIGFYIKISSHDNELLGDYTLTASDKLENLISTSYKVSGFISPEHITNSKTPSKAGFTITVKGTNLSAVTDENGYFEISDVPSSSTKEYDITIAKEGYLKRDISGILVDRDVMVSDAKAPVVIWSGDVNIPQDDNINILDVICLSKAFNSVKGDGLYNVSADINGDSVINILDVIIIAKHFNQTSDDYPQIDII